LDLLFDRLLMMMRIKKSVSRDSTLCTKNLQQLTQKRIIHNHNQI